MELRDDRHCFVCGDMNLGGLMLRFIVNEAEKSISTEFIPDHTYQGFKGIVHGGIISTVLDEAMTKLAYALGMDAVTGRLTVRFRSPLLVGERMVATGRILKESGRGVEASARAVKDDGTLVAEAEGMLIKVR